MIKTTCLALVSAAAVAFAFPSLAQDAPPPPRSAIAPEAPPAPPLPPAPPVDDIVAPEAPPAPPMSPAPPSRPVLSTHAVAVEAAHAAAQSLRANANELRKIRRIDWKHVRLESERARREARAAIERARPEIERAVAQAKVSEEAMRAIEKAQPEIDRAMRDIGPTIEHAMAKAQEGLRKAHIDMQIEKSINQALKRAQIKMEAAETRDDSSAAPDASDESAPENN